VLGQFLEGIKVLILAELEEEEGEEVILLCGDLMHQVAAEAAQELQGLVEFIWHKRGRESAEVDRLSIEVTD
jgi:hypothetical protein